MSGDASRDILPFDPARHRQQGGRTPSCPPEQEGGLWTVWGFPPLLPSPPLVFCPHGELTLSAWGDRSATWLDPVKAAEIRAANQGLPGDVRAAASAASARDVRAPNFFTVDGKGEPGRPQ